jgi:hypothetical protein
MILHVSTWRVGYFRPGSFSRSQTQYWAASGVGPPPATCHRRAGPRRHRRDRDQRLEPCSPGFHPANEYGSISAQQAGPGYGIQWGVYPNTPAETYSVDIFINGKRVDHKDQAYPPHGSVNAVDVPSGGLFQLTGTATLGSDIAYFYLTCRGRNDGRDSDGVEQAE